MIDYNDPEMPDKYCYYNRLKVGIMNFTDAIALLTSGSRLRRDAWNEINFIFLVSGSEFKVSRPPLLGIFDEGTDIRYQPHLDASYADGSVGVWTISQKDLFANDWFVVANG